MGMANMADYYYYYPVPTLPTLLCSTLTQKTYDNHIMAPGTQARLTCEWPEVSLGDVVTVIRYDANQGYLVRTTNQLAEMWLPPSVLSNNYSRKPWFKFRKQRQSPDGSSSGTSQLENSIPEGPIPEFRDKLKDITVQNGSKIVFKCRVKYCGNTFKHSWKKIEPNLCVLRNGKFTLGDHSDEGVASLAIENCKPTDSGTYCFTLTNDYGSSSCAATLTVTNNYVPIGEPKIQIVSSSSVLLEWETTEINRQFIVEYCKLGSGEWTSPNNSYPVSSQAYAVENLTAGETYSFRVIDAQNKVVGLPSVAVTLPVADNLKWQQEQFKRRYIELEEIDRGRYSVVRLAKDRGTNVEVALKQITRRKQSHHVTQAEYALLANMEHPNMIRALALFDNAPSPGVDTIVLELVKGPLLFNYISTPLEYTEYDVRIFTNQLMSALAWLHDRDIAHLDIKPENVMVQSTLTSQTPLLKLVDFGDSVNTSKNVILPPACLEFASPELVLGQPVGNHTDFWAAGVFLYVLLSGVSPFLDDSLEETTTNILKCDYCFPEDYFRDISEESKALIGRLLVLAPAQRSDMHSCLASTWFKESKSATIIPSNRLRNFMQRRHPKNVTPTTPTSPSYYKEHRF